VVTAAAVVTVAAVATFIAIRPGAAHLASASDQRTTSTSGSSSSSGAAASPSPAASGTAAAGPTSGTPVLQVPVRVNPVPAPTGAIPFAPYQEIHADCKVTEHRSDDPIVFPGRPGVSHNHTFVGNTATDAYSTAATLLTGQTSCQDTQDESGYWMPTLYQNDTVVDPSTVTIYYKSGVRDYRTVQPFPTNFRLLVGSPKTPDVAHFQGNWQCTGYQGADFPASCPAGSALIVHLKAPSCWDGLDLDSIDHVSHMAYPVNGVCPANFLVALPMLEIKVAYKLPGGVTTGLRYASGASFTFHYDFLNAWQPARLAYLVKHCINEGRQCNGLGIDPHKP
jgi:hypothetical protein